MRNGRLILSIIQEHFPFIEDQEDLFQQGMIGLIQAADRYRFDKDTSFSTYAYNWIYQHISRYVNNTNQAIRIPSYMRERMRAYQRVRASYFAEFGEDPSDEYVAAALGCTVWNINDLHFYLNTQGPESLDAYVRSDNEETESTLACFIEDERYNTEEEISDIFLSEDIENVLHLCLTNREVYIIKLRFGLTEDRKSYTLEEIGDSLGITRERVRQLEAKALKKLKNPKYKRLLNDYALAHGFTTKDTV